MRWKEPLPEYEGKHAFLSPSNYHWINYNPDQLRNSFINYRAKEEGTELHAFASYAIKNRIKLANYKKTLNMFVNDCIGFGMRSEQFLQYSDNAFGTSDAIQYKDNIMQVFDYKSGSTRTSFKQLDLYMAYCCLEHNIKPEETTFIQRIYQNNDFIETTPTGEYIREIMDRTVEADRIVEQTKRELQGGL